ncbi:MAG TPA: phosphotransferase [Actinomycetota bacterium]|nr:phosphotransferase [Actinomycetota bacterium]
MGALEGGSTGAALALVDDTGRRGVLKSHHARAQAELDEAAQAVAQALSRGWPAAAWLAWGVAGTVGYVVLDWSEGDPAESLSDGQSDALERAVEAQAGIGRGRDRLFDWSGHFERIVHPDSGLHAKCLGFSSATQELSRALVRACEGHLLPPLSRDDLVHGDFATDNVLVAGDSVSIIDTQSAGRGTRVIDLTTMGVHCLAWEQGRDTAVRFLDRAVHVGGFGEAVRCASGRALIAVCHAIDHYPHYADTLTSRLRGLADLLVSRR